MVMPINLDAKASEPEFGVGYSGLSIADPMGGQMQVSLWYPTEVPNSVVRLGPFEFPGTHDAEPAAGRFGLVVLSHGSGSSDLGHWDTAIAAFERALAANPGDGPSGLYSRRCRQYAESPPPADWDGVWTMETK